MAYLDEEGLKYLLSQMKPPKGSKAGSQEYWENNSNYIPEYGEIIIITGEGTDGDVIAIGDGMTPVMNLQTISSNLKHTLTIGSQVFDGTEDVTVEVYNGEMEDNNSNMSARMGINMDNGKTLYQMN